MWVDKEKRSSKVKIKVILKSHKLSNEVWQSQISLLVFEKLLIFNDHNHVKSKYTTDHEHFQTSCHSFGFRNGINILFPSLRVLPSIVRLSFFLFRMKFGNMATPLRKNSYLGLIWASKRSFWIPNIEAGDQNRRFWRNSLFST